MCVCLFGLCFLLLVLCDLSFFNLKCFLCFLCSTYFSSVLLCIMVCWCVIFLVCEIVVCFMVFLCLFVVEKFDCLC